MLVARCLLLWQTNAVPWLCRSDGPVRGCAAQVAGHRAPRVVPQRPRDDGAAGHVERAADRITSVSIGAMLGVRQSLESRLAERPIPQRADTRWRTSNASVRLKPWFAPTPERSSPRGASGLTVAAPRLELDLLRSDVSCPVTLPVAASSKLKHLSDASGEATAGLGFRLLR
jgi:hypothetical protein